MDVAFNLEGYTTEVVVPDEAAIVGKTVGDLETKFENEVEVVMILRGRRRNYGPDANTAFKANDILLLEAEPAVLQRVVGEAKLKLARDDKEQEIDTPSDEIGIMEAVITDESELVDRTPAQFRLYQRYQVNLLAISRRGERITRQMRSLKLKAGDVLVLRGNLNTLPETLGELHCLPLAGRDLQLGAGRHSFLPLVVLLAAMAVVSVHVLPVAIVFLVRRS